MTQLDFWLLFLLALLVSMPHWIGLYRDVRQAAAEALRDTQLHDCRAELNRLRSIRDCEIALTYKRAADAAAQAAYTKGGMSTAGQALHGTHYRYYTPD